MERITVRFPRSLRLAAEEAAEQDGYPNTSEYIRQAVREHVGPDRVNAKQRALQAKKEMEQDNRQPEIQ